MRRWVASGVFLYSLIGPAAAGDLSGQSALQALCDDASPLPDVEDASQSVTLGLEMVARCPNIDRGGALLEKAAQGGSDQANLHLGWLYMEDVGAKSPSGRFRLDRQKSLAYLRLVRGEHLAMASVLIGANLLEQSERDASLRPAGEAQLRWASAYLAKEGADLEARSRADQAANARRMQLYEAMRVLAGVARTFGVELPEFR